MSHKRHGCISPLSGLSLASVILTAGVFAGTGAAFGISAGQPVTAPHSGSSHPAAPVVTDKSLAAARVITCAVSFPQDQVKFSEEQVTACMKSVNIEAVSYIHVIATASESGSTPHNLYLSNRRAGGIEAWLTNRYPGIPVHAFGGGENPRFGMMARIFIVENQGSPDDIQPGVQVASLGTPEIIERTTTQFVTKTEYRDRPRRSLDIWVDAGPARTGLSPDIYNYTAVRFGAQVRLPLAGPLRIGLTHRLLQSNDVIDINATSLSAGRTWPLTRLLGQDLFYEQTLDAGVLQANGRTTEWGTSAAAGLQNADFRFALHGAVTNYVKSIGLGIGFRL